MTHDEAQELLELARGIRWDFPSSAGRPLRTPADAEGIFAASGMEAATDDRFELDWLRDQLTCAAN
jgi:hypothetical protein